MKGDCASRASRRAISVLPTPVGPIIRMFFGRNFLGQLRRELLPPRAVAQRDGHGALGAGLADDVLVELGDDLSRGQGFDGRGGGFRQVDGHVPAGKLSQKMRPKLSAVIAS